MGSKQRIIDNKPFVHFVTFSVDSERKLLEHDHAKRICFGRFNEVLDWYEVSCVEFVLMPDHVHALVWFNKVVQLGSFMHSWKQRSSLGLRESYHQASPNIPRAMEKAIAFETEVRCIRVLRTIEARGNVGSTCT